MFIAIFSLSAIISLSYASAKIKDIVPIFVFLIIFLSFYSFTIAPYSRNLEEGAFFVYSPLIFLTLIILYSANYTTQNFNLSDKILIFIIFSSLLISTFIINPEEISEPQGILKMICTGGSLLLFFNFFPMYLYNNSQILEKFIKIIAFIGIVSAIFGILTVVNPGLKPNNQYPGLAISFYKHPNATSSMYNFSIPILCWLIFLKRKENSAIEFVIYISGLFISIVALLFTFGRFSIVSVFISLMIIFYRSSRKLFLLAIVFIISASSYFIANFFTSKGSLTILGRFGLAETAFEMYNKSMNFLFGYGGISTREIFENVKFSLGVLDPNNNPHNIILFSILLYGIFFSLALFGFFFKYYLKSVVLFFKSNVSDLFVLSFSICTGMFLKNMAEDLLFMPEFFMWYLFLIFFGFLFIESKKFSSEKRKD